MSAPTLNAPFRHLFDHPRAMPNHTKSVFVQTPKFSQDNATRLLPSGLVLVIPQWPRARGGTGKSRLLLRVIEAGMPTDTLQSPPNDQRHGNAVVPIVPDEGPTTEAGSGGPMRDPDG